MRKPAISVVMSVHNGLSFLGAAIDSVLRQSFADFEFVIVDDGSTDGSADALDRHAASDPRIRLLHRNRGGLTSALNAGIAMAQGKFVARIDSDDVAEPDRLARQFEFLRSHEECLVVGSAVTLIDPDGDALGIRKYPTEHDAIEARHLQGDGAVPHPTAMFRYEAWQAVGGYREAFPCAQDLDLWLRLGEVGRLANLEVPLLRYRLHASAVSVQRRAEQLDCARRAVQEARRRRGLADESPVLLGGAEIPSSCTTLRQWSRMALRQGHIRTARKHAWAALKHAPWSASNLALTVRCWLRRTPAKTASGI